MSNVKKIVAVALVGVLSISSVTTGSADVQAASKVTVSKNSLTLGVGDKQNLTLKNVKIKTAKTVKWTSTNKKIVKVTFNKKTAKATVKAIKKGTATVKATLGKKTYTCKVKVLAAGQSLMMLRDTYATYVGTAVGVRPTVVGDEALDAGRLSYKSSNPKVAKIVGNQGAVEGVKAGTATITITTDLGKKLKATIKVFKSKKDADELNDFYEKIRQDKLKELNDVGITVSQGEEFCGVRKQADDRNKMVRSFSDEYLAAVKNKGGKSAYNDNTPADAIASVRSVFDVASESEKEATLIKDISEYLAPLSAAKTTDEIISLNASYIASGENGFWNNGADAQLEDVVKYTATPYFKPDIIPATMLTRKSDFADKSSDLYKSLEKVVNETLRISGETEADIAAHTPLVLAAFEKITPEYPLEDLMAMTSLSEEEQMELVKKYNLNQIAAPVAEFDAKYPGLKIADIYKSIGVKEGTKLVGPQLAGVWDDFSSYIKTASVDEIKELLRFCFAYNYIDYSEKGYAARRDYSAKKTGIINPPSEKVIKKDYEDKVIDVLCDDIGWETASEYTSKVFGDQTKKELTGLVERYKKEYREAFSECAWFSDAAREAAVSKIDNLQPVIYKPDDIKTYDLKEDLQAADEGGTIFKNLNKIHKSKIACLASVMGITIAKDDFVFFAQTCLGMTPMTVNAVYYKPINKFVIFSGVLGDETYKAGEDVYNISRIGYIVGHEIGHGFDSEGSQYDKNGDMIPWMTESDTATYESLKKKIAKAFDQYSVYYNKANETIYYANGEFELPENMADLSSIEITLRIMKDDHPGKENLDKLFRELCKVWISDKFDPSDLTGDIHAPDQARGSVPMSMFEEFYETFGVKKGDAMYVAPKNRVRLWS